MKKKAAIGISLVALVTAGGAFAAHHEGRMGPDANKDGVVTRAEAQTHATTKFAKMDANNDGVLNKADRTQRREQRRAQMFEKLDADSDGQVSRDEFMAFEHDGKRGKHHRMGRKGHRGGKMMKMADANNDGNISQAEFTTASLTRFDKVDADSDGQITKEERQAAKAEMRGKWREKMRDKAEN